MYALFHAYDYTDCIFADFLGLGEHKYDFEGFTVRVPVDGGERNVISIFHHTTDKWSSPYPSVMVEWGGHGIGRYQHTNDTCLVIGKYVDMVSLDAISPVLWDAYKQELNRHSVNMPDQWLEGRLWDCPDQLFKEYFDE